MTFEDAAITAGMNLLGVVITWAVFIADFSEFFGGKLKSRISYLKNVTEDFSTRSKTRIIQDWLHFTRKVESWIFLSVLFCFL